jgi:hypothetical protein
MTREEMERCQSVYNQGYSDGVNGKINITFGKFHKTIGISNIAIERKKYPIARGVVDYFPDALAEVSHVSFVCNEQHNPGQPLHWDKSKSTDESDALMRHLLERGKIDTDGLRHSAKVAWRALALLQRELESAKDGK